MATVTNDWRGRSGYTLDNAWPEAPRRLQLLERCYDAGTLRRLEGLQLARASSCLEVGAGAGSITRWLCSQVGPGGTVVAIDLDVRFVERIEADNLVVRKADITTAELPRDTFDVVHARALLMHLPERDAILDRLVAALRPGGWLLVEEGDHFPVTSFGTGLYREGVDALLGAMATAGVDATWARRLPQLLVDRNLGDITAVIDVPYYEGGSPEAELLSLTGVQLHNLAVSAGADPARLEAWRNLLAQPGRWFPGLAMISVAGRRPREGG